MTIIERTICARIVLFKALVQCRWIESIDAILGEGGVIGFTRLLIVVTRVYIYRVRKFIIFSLLACQTFIVFYITTLYRYCNIVSLRPFVKYI